jgi:hypothetical protein
MKCKYLPSPWILIFLMTLGILLSFLGSAPSPDRDFYFYQSFIEALASGKLDLAIPGFHGSNISAVIWYWITASPITAIEFQMLYALLIPMCAYLTGSAMFHSKWSGVMFAGIMTMMPFVSMISLIGYTSAGLMVLMLLTIYGTYKKSWWTPIIFGLAVATKPFALCLLPLMWIKRPQGSIVRQYKMIALGLLIPVLYVIIQYLQAGQITVGVHPELNETTVWQSPIKILLNLAYALQILFSVHNYHYPNPGGTGHENLFHTTPVVVFLALFAFISGKEYIKDRKLYWALLTGIAIGFGLNAIVATMNEYYMQAGMVLLILAAIPLLKKHQLWIPIVLATLHFQWFYFYLAFSDRLSLTWLFFAVPVVVDCIYLGALVASHLLLDTSDQ